MSFALETWQQGGDLIPFEEAPQPEQQVIVFMHLLDGGVCSRQRRFVFVVEVLYYFFDFGPQFCSNCGQCGIIFQSLY